MGHIGSNHQGLRSLVMPLSTHLLCKHYSLAITPSASMRHAQTQDIINDGTEKQQSSTLDNLWLLMQGIIYFSNAIYDEEQVYSNQYK